MRRLARTSFLRLPRQRTRALTTLLVLALCCSLGLADYAGSPLLPSNASSQHPQAVDLTAGNDRVGFGRTDLLKMMEAFDATREPQPAATVVSQKKKSKKTSGGSRQGKATLPEYMLYPTCVSSRSEPVVTIAAVRSGVVWEGWGTSFGHTGRFIGSLPRASDRRRLLALLFDRKDGLGLTRVRYFIPGGYNPRFSPAIVQFTTPRVAYTSYEPRPNVWNFSADWHQVRAVTEAVKLFSSEKPLHIDAVAFSPPWWMTISKDVSGNTKGLQNIAPGFIPHYAAYLTRIAAFFSNRFGIRFASLSPFNEALEGWWVKGGIHEASSWHSAGVKAMLAALRRSRVSQGIPWLPIAGVDSWLKFSGHVMNTLYAKSPLGFNILTVHGYRTHRTMGLIKDMLAMTAVRDAARRRRVKVWMSEWGPLQVKGSPLDNAVFTGRNIAQHINLLGASVWYYWDALNQPNNISWGAIHQRMYDWSQVRPVVTKTFYALQHYTRFIREGSILLKVPKACASAMVAVYSPAGRRVAVTAANQQTKAVTVWLSLKGFVQLNRRREMVVTSYLTSATSDFQSLGSQPVPNFNRRFAMKLPPQSILTLSFRNVVPRLGRLL